MLAPCTLPNKQWVGYPSSLVSVWACPLEITAEQFRCAKSGLDEEAALPVFNVSHCLGDRLGWSQKRYGPSRGPPNLRVGFDDRHARACTSTKRKLPTWQASKCNSATATASWASTVVLLTDPVPPPEYFCLGLLIRVLDSSKSTSRPAKHHRLPWLRR